MKRVERKQKRGATLDYSPARGIVQTPGAYLDIPLDASVCMRHKITNIFNEPSHITLH